MKALTLTQPWATLVAVGAKQIETRSWQTNYRGRLAIHAAKGFPRDAIELCFDEPFAAALRVAGITKPADLPRGMVLATCRLVTCWQFDGADTYIVGHQREEHVVRLTEPELSFGDFTPGRFGWLLADISRRTPVLARGSLGLWDWEPA